MSNKKSDKAKDTFHPLYYVWRSIIDRTTVKSHPSYKINKSRSVEVCSRWCKSFKAFVYDMGERPGGHYLSRKNKYRNYDKNNCYWAQYKTGYRVDDKSFNQDIESGTRVVVDDVGVSLDLD
jgi:hypothetical protein